MLRTVTISPLLLTHIIIGFRTDKLMHENLMALVLPEYQREREDGRYLLTSSLFDSDG
jgi:hypothetical protein